MKRKLEIEEQTARRLYPTAAPEFKELLEENFGKNFFKLNFLEREWTFKDVCVEAGVDYNDFIRVCNSLPTDESGFKKVKLICKVFNQGWILDYTDSNQYKYFPRHVKNNNGAGFVCDANDYWSSTVRASAAPCQALKNKETAIFVGQNFLAEYNELYTL